MSIEEKDDSTLALSRSYNAPVARVFKAWTDPEDLRRWYAPVDGWTVSKAEVDLRVGGGYHLEFGPPDGEQVVEKGHYEEIVEGSLLVFRISVEGQNTDEATRVRVEFVESAGRAEVTIVESKYSSKAARDMHAKGWSHCLDLLTSVVETA